MRTPLRRLFTTVPIRLISSLIASSQLATLDARETIDLHAESETATEKNVYRYELDAPKRWIGQKALLLFGETNRNATILVNEKEAKATATPYASYAVDITSDLQLGANNQIEVRIDDSGQPSSQGGLHPSVAIRIVDPIHISPEDIATSTWFISEDGKLATIDISAATRNESEHSAEILLDLTVIDPNGLPVTRYTQFGQADSGSSFTIAPKLGVPYPRLWNSNTPNTYRLVTRSYVDGRLTDRQETEFDIRQEKPSADNRQFPTGEWIAQSDSGRAIIRTGNFAYRNALSHKASLDINAERTQ